MWSFCCQWPLAGLSFCQVPGPFVKTRGLLYTPRSDGVFHYPFNLWAKVTLCSRRHHSSGDVMMMIMMMVMMMMVMVVIMMMMMRQKQKKSIVLLSVLQVDWQWLSRFIESKLGLAWLDLILDSNKYSFFVRQRIKPLWCDTLLTPALILTIIIDLYMFLYKYFKFWTLLDKLESNLNDIEE